MPKVTEKYLRDKRNYILECIGKILREKPLYSVTMRDIIKEAGFSQGIIYHYYASLDEIFIDYINKNTTYDLLEQNINTLLSSDLTEKEILFECILSIGKYIDELLKSVGGKTCFELIVFYSFDIEKRATVHPKLNFKKSLAYAQNRIVDYTLKNIEKGIFLPRIPIHSLVMFISSFIDGIAQNVATSEAEENNNSMNIIEMFQILAKAMISF